MAIALKQAPCVSVSSLLQQIKISNAISALTGMQHSKLNKILPKSYKAQKTFCYEGKFCISKCPGNDFR